MTGSTWLLKTFFGAGWLIPVEDGIGWFWPDLWIVFSSSGLS